MWIIPESIIENYRRQFIKRHQEFHRKELQNPRCETLVSLLLILRNEVYEFDDGKKFYERVHQVRRQIAWKQCRRETGRIVQNYDRDYKAIISHYLPGIPRYPSLSNHCSVQNLLWDQRIKEARSEHRRIQRTNLGARMMRRTPANHPESRELAQRRTHPPSFYRQQRTEENLRQARTRLEQTRARQRQRNARNSQRRSQQRQVELMKRYLR